MDNFRPVIGYAKEPIQQSMVSRMEDFPHLQMGRFELGVVLSVYPADKPENRTAKESSIRRGWRHECTVQIVSSGHGGIWRISNVVIPPRSPSGVNNYEEQLPRGSTQTFKKDAQFDPSMQLTSPYDLDGDWCVVAFLNNDIDQPFIVSWWPSLHNTLDPQTSGEGNPDSSGNGTALDQFNRYFKRTNGVEYTISKEGNIYLATTFAGEDIHIHEPTINGRFTRQTNELGGNIKVVVKEQGIVELDFNTPPDGIGIKDELDKYLIQSNPRPQTTPVQQEKVNTYLSVDNSMLQLKCPDSVKFKTKLFELIASDNIVIQAPNIDIGKDNTQLYATFEYGNFESKGSLDILTHEQFAVDSETMVLDVVGTLEIKAASTTVDGGAFIDLISNEISAGSSESAKLPLLRSTVADESQTAFATLITTPAPTPSSATPSSNAAAIAAIYKYIQSLNSALQNGQTEALLAN